MRVVRRYGECEHGPKLWAARQTRTLEHYDLAMKPDPFAPFTSRLTRWQEFRITLTVRWVFCKLALCQASPLLALNDVGDEFLYARRPRLARLLFPRAAVLHPSQPIPNAKK